MLSSDYKYRLAHEVSRIKPGQCLQVDSTILGLYVAGMDYNGARFTPADMILENVVGSSYEFWYTEDIINRRIIFHRAQISSEEPIYYRSPDRK